MFIRNVFLVEERERSDLYICHTILLCTIVMMLLRTEFVHVYSRWRHVSISCSGHML